MTYCSAVLCTFRYTLGKHVSSKCIRFIGQKRVTQLRSVFSGPQCRRCYTRREIALWKTAMLVPIMWKMYIFASKEVNHAYCVATIPVVQLQSDLLLVSSEYSRLKWAAINYSPSKAGHSEFGMLWSFIRLLSLGVQVLRIIKVMI